MLNRLFYLMIVSILVSSNFFGQTANFAGKKENLTGKKMESAVHKGSENVRIFSGTVVTGQFELVPNVKIEVYF